ncbi:hypothetical protein ABVT39_002493 [Epinephelus coioides]
MDQVQSAVKSAKNGVDGKIKTPTSFGSENKKGACQLCQAIAGFDTKSLICKRCKTHHCIKCLKKDEVEYVILQKPDMGFKWFCPYCEECVEKSIAIEQMIEEKCQQIIQEMEKQMQELESMLEGKCDEKRVVEIIQEQLKDTDKGSTSWADIVRTPKENTSAVKSVLSELDERKSREWNIVLFGIKDYNLENREERQKKELKVVKDLFKSCKVRTATDSFVRVTRLGKLNRSEEAEESARPGRPILVTLQSMELKISLFRKISALHQMDNFKNVRVANDLTRTESEKERELYEKVQEKQRKSSGEYIFKVRGPPWARRVVRMHKTECYAPV